MNRALTPCGLKRSVGQVFGLIATGAQPLSGAKYSLGRSCMAEPVKKQCLRVGTHSGTFHCDEALACWLLTKTTRFQDAQIVRSRDKDVLKDMDAVVDVGGVYDPGREVISNLLEIDREDTNMDTIYLTVYRQFIEAVDAIDNGINQWDGDTPPKYICNTNLSARVGQLNADWNEDSSAESQNDRFFKAMKLTGTEFESSVGYVYRSWLPARQYVAEAIQERYSIDPSGLIMRLNHYCPWKSHLYDLEKDLKLTDLPLYCLYEDTAENAWRIQAVAASPGSFQSRKALPLTWRGLREGELDSVCGISGCIFVHASGFIGGHKHYDGALRMAQKAIEI